jgi:drug/metabolite transporter (DMT)-like permease
MITDTLPPWAPWALLSLGMTAASFAAILIRYASDADALAISFWRCAAGALALLPFAYRKLRSKSLADHRIPAVAGFFLALHFGTWIASVNLTSIAASVLLVSLAPIFVALIAPRFLDERLSRLGWIGIAVALAGTAIVAGKDLGGTSFEGNLLALIGAATAGYYVLAGQLARRNVGILEYAVVAYAVAAALLLPMSLITGADLFGFDAKTWWSIVGLVVGPQLLGHTVINLVLSDIDATTVSVSIMAEPVIAIALAFVLFDETPSWLIYPGGAMILAGIYLVSSARRTIEPIPE